MANVQEKEVHQAFNTILDDEDSKALNYAINYTRAGLYMTGEELKVQCLYILHNITHWRHPEAKAVRQALKDFTKGR